MKSIFRRKPNSAVESMDESKAPTTTESAGSQDGENTEPTEPETLTRAKTDEEDEYITGFKLAAVMGSITLVVFLLLLDMTIVATAIPHITTQFHSLVSKSIPGNDIRAVALFHRLVRAMSFSETLQGKCLGWKLSISISSCARYDRHKLTEYCSQMLAGMVPPISSHHAPSSR
jgi:hypothetical protein